MFKKLVAIEPVSLIPTAEEALHQYAEQVELYRDIPADDEEIVRRIGDAAARRRAPCPPSRDPHHRHRRPEG